MQTNVKYLDSGLLKDRVKPEMAIARSFYENDLWLEGDGLAVRKPKNDVEKLSEIEEGFATQNVIEEVVDRKRDGVLGREPLPKIVRKDGRELNKEEENLIRQTEAALTEWWNKREILGTMKDSFVGAMLERRSEVRPYAPPAAYDKKTGSLKKVSTFDEALKLLHFKTISPQSAGVFLDEETLEPFSIYEYEKGGKNYLEVSLIGADGLTHLARIEQDQVETFAARAFPNSLGKYEKTWFQKVVEAAKSIINKNSKSTEFNYAPLDLDGKLYLYELDLKRPFVTAPMCSLQKQISLDYTMKGRNTYTGGFRSKHWLNARPPQGIKEIADANAPGGKRIVTYDKPMKDGAGVQSFVQGAKIYDEEGKVKGVATPNLVVVDPVSTQTFIDSKKDNRAGILAMAKQEHVLSNMESSPSGFSRQQARSEFKTDLTQDGTCVDNEGRYILEFAMMFAANLTGQVERFKQYRVDFKSIIDAGILSPEEKKDNREAYEAGEISLETLQSRNGVEDTEAELTKIKSEDGYEINRLEKVLNVLAKANGKLPLATQVEFLVKSLGKEEEWNAEKLVNELNAENDQKRKDEMAVKSNGNGAFVR